jgi:hypothetical protein
VRERLERWPLLGASALLLTLGLGVEWTNAAALAGAGLILLGAATLGAFVYAEGARHREWWHESHGHADTPAGEGTGQDAGPSG